MSDFGTEDAHVRTFTAVLDLILLAIPRPALRHSFLIYVQSVVDKRIAAALNEIRRGTPPPPRKPSSPILPPAPAEPWSSRTPTDRTAVAFSRAETEAKNPGELLRLAREEDAAVRDTPIVPDPRREPDES